MKIIQISILIVALVTLLGYSIKENGYRIKYLVDTKIDSIGKFEFTSNPCLKCLDGNEWAKLKKGDSFKFAIRNGKLWWYPLYCEKCPKEYFGTTLDVDTFRLFTLLGEEIEIKK